MTDAMAVARKRSHKRMDPDIKVLRACTRALLASSSERMLVANMEYLWDRFIEHPPAGDKIARATPPPRAGREGEVTT